MVDNVETVNGILRFFLCVEPLSYNLEDKLQCHDQRHV